MKKITIILAIFCVTLISSVRADIRLGVKAGVNLAEPSFNMNSLQTSNFTGYQAGPILELKVPVIGIGFDVAVLYSQQGLKFKFNDVNFEERHSTLDIPVNLKYKFEVFEGFGGYLTAGPYASFKLKEDNLSAREIYTEFKNEDFSAGINLGGGIELFKHLQVGVNYRISLTDDYKTFTVDDLALNDKIRIWSITAAYFF